MTKHTGHIKNPLTVISVFAGIAEISGTIVLPFIATENQATYIWFLMLFPPFLVGIFFATLNWNHRTLYAPSDYQNEDNFIISVGRSTSFERVIKLSEEVADIVADVSNATSAMETPMPEPPHDRSHCVAPATKTGGESPSSSDFPPQTPLELEPSAEKSPPHKTSDKISPELTTSQDSTSKDKKLTLETNRITTDLRLIEELSIKEITKLTGLPFMKGMKMLSKNGEVLHFDAGVAEKDHFHALEVKYYKGRTFNTSRLKGFLDNCQNIVTSDGFFSKRFTLHLAIVTPFSDGVTFETLTNLLGLTKNLDFKVELHMFSEDELLEKQYHP